MQTTPSTSVQEEKKVPKKVKVITWDTNYNNKLACNAFIHIDLKPKMVPVKKDFSNLIIEIRTADNSHPAVKVELLDMLFIPFQRIGECLALASHGLTDMELADFLFDKHQPDFSFRTEMAIYVYKRTTDFFL